MSRDMTSYGEKFRKEHPEKFKLLCKAMERTHGQADNRLTQDLLHADNVTVEDLVRLGGSYKGDYIHEFWYEKEKYGETRADVLDRRKAIRRKRDKEAHEFKFKDSYLYRAMVKMGMSPNEEGGGNNDWGDRNTIYNTNPSRTAGGYACGGERLAGTKYAEVTVMYMRAGEELRHAIMGSELLSQAWTEQARVQREVDRIYNASERERHPITSTNEEWRKFQSDHIIKEFSWLANMPENVKKDWEVWNADKDRDKHGWRSQQNAPTLTNTILGAFRYPSEDKSQELIREAYGVMEYIGIGVCWNFKNPDGTTRVVYCNQKSVGVGAMLKKTSSMMRRFTADLRKGYAPEDIRELIVEDLNNWAESKVGGRWQFYARVDAPNEYEGFTKKKKAHKATQSLELDENNPEDKGFLNVIDKINGKE